MDVLTIIPNLRYIYFRRSYHRYLQDIINDRRYSQIYIIVDIDVIYNWGSDQEIVSMSLYGNYCRSVIL